MIAVFFCSAASLLVWRSDLSCSRVLLLSFPPEVGKRTLAKPRSGYKIIQRENMPISPIFTDPEVKLPRLSTADNARLDAMAEEDFANGVAVPLEETMTWVESWGTPNELPAPKVRKLH